MRAECGNLKNAKENAINVSFSDELKSADIIS
jgi:hypothetical protein